MRSSPRHIQIEEYLTKTARITRNLLCTQNAWRIYATTRHVKAYYRERYALVHTTHEESKNTIIYVCVYRVYVFDIFVIFLFRCVYHTHTHKRTHVRSIPFAWFSVCVSLLYTLSGRVALSMHRHVWQMQKCCIPTLGRRRFSHAGHKGAGGGEWDVRCAERDFCVARALCSRFLRRAACVLELMFLQ